MSALFPMLFSVLAVQCKFLIANFIEHAKSCLFSPYFMMKLPVSMERCSLAVKFVHAR